jgi:hypothetical protein
LPAILGNAGSRACASNRLVRGPERARHPNPRAVDLSVQKRPYQPAGRQINWPVALRPPFGFGPLVDVIALNLRDAYAFAAAPKPLRQLFGENLEACARDPLPDARLQLNLDEVSVSNA